jgi:hypothetical protein
MAADSPQTPRECVDILPEWLAEFEAAAARSLEQHVNNSFIRTYKPVLDDAEYRSWESTAEYRRWCRENLPEWLGYGRI